ncbi:glycosyltransferase family 9 protein [Rhizobium sp. PL01]|uniref:glycosyltransferase family 9 protein n=1 Tax=Rhizobium sp. PL01 TaxID=3085631 RepID=UPI002981D8BE|nr:glycosyltransferase family 9 protein [Rhizobium sp. PL01]MDW5315998.1 glycosyltransferase family 9 protein [Rhizobium sp. PL01]
MNDADKIFKEKLLVSILIFSGTENIDRLLSKLPENLLSACGDLNLEIEVIIRKNNPNLDTIKLEGILRALNETNEAISFLLVDEGTNSGFGRGHNLNYRASPADYLFILNDDLDMPHLDWMRIAVRRLREEKKLAMIGDVSNPNAINPFFANGTFPDQHRNFTLRYAEASILLVRGAAFEEIGMFDETIAWAMGEDSDLSFKAQQAGYYIDWLSMPHRHFRSTSFNSLPQYQKSSVLEHNRARLLAKWGNSFDTGTPGKYEVLDIFSDGLGDMFCALLHVKAEFDRLPRTVHDHIVVNVANETLARILLPDHANIASERDVNVLRNKLSNNEVASLRSSRTINYALPYNIHSLLSGALSLPFADDKTLAEAAAALKSVLPTKLVDGDYCVIHLEFERENHHGRGPSPQLIKAILANAGLLNCKIVLIGKNRLVTPEFHPTIDLEIIDLQGKTSIRELISVVANAKYMLGIDSFPFHVAQVARVPTAAFFGSVSPILRVLHENMVWPIVAGLDCLGCYHDQIEPGAPFCMKMNEQCTYDVSESNIENAILGMVKNTLYDWTRLKILLNKKTARFVEYQKFHPTSREQLHNTVIPNQQISELVYELTDRISQTYSRHLSGSFVSQLQKENDRMRGLLLDAQTKIGSYESVKTLVPREVEKLDSYSAAELIWRRTRCAAYEDKGEIICDSTKIDPHVEFLPIRVKGLRFGVSIAAKSHPHGSLKLYWKAGNSDYTEDDSFTMDLTEHSSSRVWWYSGPIDRPIHIRIDPSEGPGHTKMTVKFLGDLDRDAMLQSLKEVARPKASDRLKGVLKRLS